MDVTVHIPDDLAERLGAGGTYLVERSKHSHWRNTGAATSARLTCVDFWDSPLVMNSTGS